MNNSATRTNRQQNGGGIQLCVVCIVEFHGFRNGQGQLLLGLRMWANRSLGPSSRAKLDSRTGQVVPSYLR